MPRQVTRQHLPPKYVSNETPKKTFLAIVNSFINAPTVQAITPNAVVRLDLPH